MSAGFSPKHGLVHLRALPQAAEYGGVRQQTAARPNIAGVDVLLALHLALGARDDRYDVAVVVSADSDLLPAIEEAVRLGKRVETATWWTPPLPRRARRIPNRALWNHYLGVSDFQAVRDDTDYLMAP
ncbi:NYN domain-containing protein [Candidatus Poriferisodalis sp.]|uniref:NYN domain-containing protein n=1 Tax=Candidatus Poriferisodalis sp. TaxID=3101277 RepID=UPI003D0C193C